MQESQGRKNPKFEDGMNCLSNGQIDMAFEIFSELAGARDLRAYMQLGILFARASENEIKCSQIAELSTREMEAKAELNFRSGAGFDDPECWFQLGMILSKYYNVSRLREAIDWFEKAARRGHLGAQLKAAHLLKLFNEYNKAFWLFKQAASSGDPEACYFFAMAHFANRMCPPGFQPSFFSLVPKIEQMRVENYKRGALFLKEAAESGYPDAEYLWGMLLDNGLREGIVTIVEQNKRLGNEFIHKASEHGHHDAINVIAGNPPFNHLRNGFG